MSVTRDSCKPFAPTEYKNDKEDSESVHGIEIVRSLASEIIYIRAIDMNNTVLTFGLKEASNSKA